MFALPSVDRTLIRVSVQLTNIMGERYWAPDTQLPPQVQIAVNINIVGVDQRTESLVEAPFVFTVNYQPSIAQLSIRGKAQITGDRNELTQIVDDGKKSKPPPQSVIQAVSSVAMADAIVVSKSLGIPPPLPPIGGAPEGTLAQPTPKKEPRYTT